MSAQSTIQKLRSEIAKARERGESDGEIIAALTKALTPEQLVELHREAVAEDRTSLEGHIQKTLYEAVAKGGSATSFVIGSTTEDGGGRYSNLPKAGSHPAQWVDTGDGAVRKDGTTPSTVNDGLTDAERTRARAIQKGR
jgi:hypothetical protein